MPSLKERVLALVNETPGFTDRQLTDRLMGSAALQQPVNQAARALVADGFVSRRRRAEGKLGNFPGTGVPPVAKSAGQPAIPDGRPVDSSGLCEDDVKRAVTAWLESSGWEVDVRWGRERGIDIEATREGERWVIEAKGCGSRDAMRVSYFIAMLGETLQRMGDPSARYSIALPDMTQFRRLWSRLPALAKSRTQISVLFVAANGSVEQVP